MVLSDSTTLRIDSDTWFVFSVLFISSLALLIVVYIYIPFKARKRSSLNRHERFGKRIEKISNLQKKHSLQVISQLKADNEKLQTDLYEELQNLLISKDASPKLTGFYTKFEKLHPHFTAAVQNKYPMLTVNELNLCAFLRLNLNSKEISRLLNISPDSVNKARYRLRKKLNIDQKIDLTTFIINI